MIPTILLAAFLIVVLTPLFDTRVNDPVFQADRRAAGAGPQTLLVNLPPRADVAAARQVLASHGVTRAEPYVLLRAADCASTRPTSTRSSCLTAVVTTCWGLEASGLLLDKCQDDHPAWLSPPATMASELTLSDGRAPSTLSVEVRNTSRMTWRQDPSSLEGTDVGLFVPPSSPGAQEFLNRTGTQLIVSGPGGIGVEEELQEALQAIVPQAEVTTTRAFANYVTLRNIQVVLQLSMVALISVGLLAFALATFDQVLSRRVLLPPALLLGIPRRTLRAAQLVETISPTILGLPAALALGWVSSRGLPTTLTAGASGPVVLVALAVVSAVFAVALSAAAACVPKLNPDTLRRP